MASMTGPKAVAQIYGYFEIAKLDKWIHGIRIASLVTGLTACARQLPSSTKTAMIRSPERNSLVFLEEPTQIDSIRLYVSNLPIPSKS